MEQNMQVIAKKAWNLVRVVFYLLRKGISSKGKLMRDLNMMLKRGKIAGKALQNLMFHHHHAWSISTINHRNHHDKNNNNNLPYNFPSPAPGEYEFSCSNTPTYPLSLFSSHKKHNNNHHSHFFSCAHAPQTDEYQEENAAVMKALEMLQSHSELASPSPALPGFGQTPMVRQLRITDSPFPLATVDEEGTQVDEAAEKFIKKFYKDLKKQNNKSFDFSRIR